MQRTAETIRIPDERLRELQVQVRAVTATAVRLNAEIDALFDGCYGCRASGLLTEQAILFRSAWREWLFGHSVGLMRCLGANEVKFLDVYAES